MLRLLAILAALWLVGCSTPDQIGDPIDGLEYRWDDRPYQPVRESLAHDPPARDGAHELVLRFVVPSALPDDPAIFVGNGRTLSGASIDGRPLPLHPAGWGVLALEREDIGKTVELHFRTERGIRPFRVAIASQRDIPRVLIRADAKLFTIGAVLCAIGIFFCIGWIFERSRRAIGWLGAFAITLGITFLCEADWLSSSLWRGGDAMWTVHAFATLAYPVAMMGFTSAIFPDSRFFRISLRALLPVVPIVAVLHATGIVDADAVRRRFLIVILALAIATVVVVTPRARRGDKTARLFLGGYAALTLFALPDISWGLGFLILPVHVSEIGTLVFAIAMGLVVDRSYRDQSIGLAQSKAELEARIRELEKRKAEIEKLDGELRHQVERRSRELGDVLARGAQRFGDALIAIGDVIDDRYRVEEALGAGAMGAVYRVTRITDDRALALKVMVGAGDPVRFAREAEIAARVRHPNIVAVVDVGVASRGFLYLVMELVRGKALDELRERFGDRVFARRILRDVAKGLEALHASSVVHRDLKPSNILIEEDGTARIADFGIARVDRDASPLARTESAQTADGLILGTPQYMAPENARDPKSVGPAADVFAFGLIACEISTGRFPYTMPPVLQALAATPARPDLDGLEEDDAKWIARALDNDPKNRPSASELVTFLERNESPS